MKAFFKGVTPQEARRILATVVPVGTETVSAVALEQALLWGNLVLLSGGSSVGTKDIAMEAILSFPEAKVLFHGISVSPGKPTIYAQASGKPIMGLPGYPVSALVIFDLFAAPLLRIIGGEDSQLSLRRTSLIRPGGRRISSGGKVYEVCDL